MTIRVKDVKELKILMIKKGFTQRGLAKAAGISDTTVCHLVNNKCGCGPEIAAKICKTLEVEFDGIFFIDNDDKCKQNDFNYDLPTGTEGG